MLGNVRRTLRKYNLVASGDTVVVACSGGPDSTALLHALWRLRGELGVTLHVAHLDHGLRGAESRHDLQAVADLAVSLGLPATLGTADVARLARRQGWSKQVAAREARYSFLQRVALEVGARSIALGHNQGDQAETVVMRLLRGTGLEGLGGIPPVRPIPGLPGGLVIRPLLFSTREEIEAYCQEEGLAPRQDPSNLKPVYQRNRIRLQVLPELRRINPRLDRALSDLAEQARDESAWLEQQATDLLDRMKGAAASGRTGALVLDLGPFRQAPVALQRRVLRRALRERLGGLGLAAGRGSEAAGSYQQVESLRSLALSPEPTGHLDLSLGLAADRRADRLFLQPVGSGGGQGDGMGRDTGGDGGPADTTPPVSLLVPGRTDIPALGWAVEAEVLPGPLRPAQMIAGEAYLDLSRIEQPLFVRARRPGDRFRPLGGPGTKRLKDFLQEQRVPAAERGRLPLVVMGDRILWVGGLRPAEAFRVTEGTDRVLHLRLLPLSPSGLEN